MNPGILSVDIGGTTIKTAVIDKHGAFLSEPLRVPTPMPCGPELLMSLIEQMVQTAPAYDRIAVGFPGPIKLGRILTAKNLGSHDWIGLNVADLFQSRLGCPTRVANDADMQGYALISGAGLEFALILGTGVGTSLFREGELMPHMELAHHPVADGMTYEQYLGAKAFRAAGPELWNQRLGAVLDLLETLLHPDEIHVSGGNAVNIVPALAARVALLGDRNAGLRGGFGLWRY